MIKRILNYVRRKQEIRLRKWCIHYSAGGSTNAAQRVYDWVTSVPAQSEP